MTVSISGAIDFLQDKYVLSPALQGPVISSSIIGGVIGAGFSGFLSDKYGRRRSTGRRAIPFTLSERPRTRQTFKVREATELSIAECAC